MFNQYLPGEEVNFLHLGEIGNFVRGDFVRRSDFGNLNLFQSQKQHSVNTEPQLKSRLA